MGAVHDATFFLSPDTKLIHIAAEETLVEGNFFSKKYLHKNMSDDKYRDNIGGMMYIFSVHGAPASQKQTNYKRSSSDGRIWMYDPSQKSKEYIQWQIKPFMTDQPLEGPIEMFITFFLPIPKSTSGAQRRQMINRILLPSKKPDIDNLAYLVTNALKGIVYKDDNQLCALHLYKFYDSDPRTVIKVRPILEVERVLEVVGGAKENEEDME